MSRALRNCRPFLTLLRALGLSSVEVWATTTRIENYFQPSTTPTSTDDRTVPWPEQISKLAFGWQSRDWLVTARFLVADSIKTLGSLNVGCVLSVQCCCVHG